MIKELDYQTKAVDELVEKCAKLLQSGGERKKLVFKAPTGAGKTVMASKPVMPHSSVFGRVYCEIRAKP